MTSAKRPASRSDSSPDAREPKSKDKGFWANDVEPMADDDNRSHDGFEIIPAQSGKDKKKKKVKPQTSLEDFIKTTPPGAFGSKIPVKARKAAVKRCTPTAPGGRRKAQSIPGASIATPTLRPNGPPPPKL